MPAAAALKIKKGRRKNWILTCLILKACVFFFFFLYSYYIVNIMSLRLKTFLCFIESMIATSEIDK